MPAAITTRLTDRTILEKMIHTRSCLCVKVKYHHTPSRNLTSSRHGLSTHLGDNPACNPPVTKKSDPVVKVLASDNR
jgi:hypothetical protein